jgi:peptide/nickel transport system substrate-binding protein
MTAKHKADVDWRSPTYLMGTGPFKLKEAISGSSIELVKNPDYFRTGKPYLDGFTQYIIAAPSAQMDAVTTKRADMTNPMGFGIASKDDADRFLTTAKGTTTEMRYSTTGNLIWFNTKYKPISDARVRKAFSLIADRAIMATASWGDVSFATLKHGFFPPYWGLPPDEVNKLTNWNNTEAERVAEAKKLMADAGYSDGFKLTMLTVSMPSFERQFVWLADQLKKNLKIEAEIRTMELAELLKVRGTGDFQVLCYASLAILGEPNEFMPLFTTGNPSNYGGYSNPQLDALWKQQANEMDLNKRKQLVQQIERILLTDMPAMPTGFNHYLVGWWPYVKGFVVQGGSYTSNLTFENVWLDK